MICKKRANSEMSYIRICEYHFRVIPTDGRKKSALPVGNNRYKKYQPQQIMLFELLFERKRHVLIVLIGSLPSPPVLLHVWFRRKQYQQGKFAYR